MAWTQVGTIRLSEEKRDEDGDLLKAGKLYIKFHANQEKDGSYSHANLKELSSAITSAGSYGISLQIEKPVDKLKRLNELGFIKDADLEKRIEQVPDYIKYEISLPPQKD